MAFKLNTQRTFKAPVPIGILTEEGKHQVGEFYATFRVLNEAQKKEMAEKKMLDAILVELHELELFNGDIELKGDELLSAAKADEALSKAMMRSFLENVEKKPQSKT